jgi:ADP-heptose:LPS heptosyltransferase
MHLATPQKILLVRFSSIGDIVLTFPVAAAIKSLYPACQIDYVTKQHFKGLLEACPQIDQVFTLNDSLGNLRGQIDFSQYDAIFDLHNNLRTRLLLQFRFSKVYRFPKNNWQKWLLTTFKMKPKKRQHVVERYLDTLQSYSGVAVIGSEHCYQIPVKAQIGIQELLELEPQTYVAVAIGAQFATKRMPTDLLIELIDQIKAPVLLLGGKEDEQTALNIMTNCTKKEIRSAVGATNIHESAWLVQNAVCLVTHDTGLMHIAANFELPLFVIWGNTTRDFGMYPYRLEQQGVQHFEVSNLACRPCSKIGSHECPKGHFACMRNQDVDQLAAKINAI